jgi:hypothetical protein
VQPRTVDRLPENAGLLQEAIAEFVPQRSEGLVRITDGCVAIDVGIKNGSSRSLGQRSRTFS